MNVTRFFVLIVVLGLTGYNYYLNTVGTTSLINTYEWRIANLDLLFKAQHKNVDDCMTALPDDKAREIYRKHREELEEKIKEYLSKKQNG